jgi:hypothetical protein
MYYFLSTKNHVVFGKILREVFRTFEKVWILWNFVEKGGFTNLHFTTIILTILIF